MASREPIHLRVLVAVGSRSDRVCSVGAFARAEARALDGIFSNIELLEPNAEDQYPVTAGIDAPDVVLYHAPSLHDRGKPWRPLASALKLRRAFPRALFIPVVHEFSEAPFHWKLRQIAILEMSAAAITNTRTDFEGLSPWKRRLTKIHLGPTLFIPELLAETSRAERAASVARLRTSARRDTGYSGEARRLLHPGLLTPGKGLDALKVLLPALGKGTNLIVMGGLGPKPSDRDFARQALRELEDAAPGRVTFVEAPDDRKFRDHLLAADLVVLPYDVGLSERRSSFLSAASCGANIWTTTGVYSSAMELEKSGAHTVTAETWALKPTEAAATVARALEETDDRTLERRARNLEWASKRSWESRVSEIARFISSLR